MIEEICEKDMTGVFEIGNEDVRILIEAESPATFDDLVKICANAHSADICYTECGGGEYDPLDEERKMAEEKRGYSVKLTWYKLNYPKEFYKVYFETYVYSAE